MGIRWRKSHFFLEFFWHIMKGKVIIEVMIVQTSQAVTIRDEPWQSLLFFGNDFIFSFKNFRFFLPFIIFIFFLRGKRR